MSLFEFQQPEDPRFLDTCFIVEATFCEQSFLWAEWSSKIQWEEEYIGYAYTIGYINVNGHDYPVIVHCRWVILNGIRVLFYDTTSMVTHYEWAKEWVDKVCGYPKWARGTRRASTSAINFHHVVDFVKQSGN